MDREGKALDEIGEKEIGDMISGFALQFIGLSNSLVFRGCPGIYREGSMPNNNDERLLNRQEAAAFLGERGYRVAVATLNKWASIGGGPKFRKFSRRPLYAPADLVAWAEARTSPPVGSVTEAEALRVTGRPTRASDR